jgi:hypothetical protein
VKVCSGSACIHCASLSTFAFVLANPMVAEFDGFGTILFTHNYFELIQIP